MEKENISEKDQAALIDEYLSVVNEIRKRKKKITLQERKEYLKKLLTPLLKLSDPYYELDSTYDFINEDIRIGEEIDIDQLIYDKKKYRIELDPLNDKAFHPDRSNICIHEDFRKYHAEREKKDKARLAYIEQLEREGAKVPGSLRCPPPPNLDGGMTSIRELYEKWLPSLTPELITSKDLLNQILVCFTIKRALNGDKNAIDKLYALYEDTAIGTAVKLAKARKLLHYVEDIKQESKILLRQIISGLGPKEIVDSLINNKPVPLSVEMFYFWYYSEYIPEELNKILNIPPEDRLGSRPWWHPRRPGEPAKITNFPLEMLDGLEISVRLNVYSPIRHDTFFTKKIRTMKFNNYSFRPNKKTNLTTWLFGTKNNPMQGKFPQLLSDTVLDRLAKTHKEYLHHFMDEGIENEGQNVHEMRVKIQLKSQRSGNIPTHSPLPCRDKGYRCPKCTVGFTSFILYKDRKKVNTLECPSCGHTFHA